MAINDDKKRPVALKLAPSRVSSTDSSSSSTSSLKPPRTPRFAEATTIHSPVEPQVNPFSDRAEASQSQIGDVGFGYINDAANRGSAAVPMTPRSPLKSAMKMPGTARRLDNPLSPTFREEQALVKREVDTEKEQVKDVKIKTRVRLAKIALRGVNFSCSLIILSMMSASFVIFDLTRTLPTENGLPPWAANTNAWPQKVVLGAACVSLTMCSVIFVGYCRGGHRRAEKVAVYYTLFAVSWFIFSMVMWAAAAGIIQFSKNNTNNQDMWGWSCLDNTRSDIFSQKVDYALVCRLQSWSLVCIVIEVVVEVISIMLYSIVFYRYYSKRKLYKSMTMRDKARSDLYLAQLRTQSAPNTPGFGPKSPAFSHLGPKSPAFSHLGPKSPAFSQYAMSPRFPPQTYRSLGDIDETVSPFTPGGNRLVEPQSSFAKPKEAAFKLQAPPTRANPATPRSPASAFRAAPPTTTTTTPSPAPSATVNKHGPVAPGEQQYDAVPIPGAYADAAVKSPPAQQTTFNLPQPGPAYIR